MLARWTSRQRKARQFDGFIEADEDKEKFEAALDKIAPVKATKRLPKDRTSRHPR
jgi:hypothetical protein